MSDLCPVYAPFFGAMVSSKFSLFAFETEEFVGLHLLNCVRL